MKKIFITIMAAAAVLTGCNTVLIESAGVGQLSVCVGDVVQRVEGIGMLLA